MMTTFSARNYIFKIDPARSFNFQGLPVRKLVAEPLVETGHKSPHAGGYSQAVDKLTVGSSFLIPSSLVQSNLVQKLREISRRKGIALAYLRGKDASYRVIRINQDQTLPWEGPPKTEFIKLPGTRPMPVPRAEITDLDVEKVTGHNQDEARSADLTRENVARRKQALFEIACGYADEHQKPCLYEDAADVSSDRRAIMAAFVAGFACKARMDASINKEIAATSLGSLIDDLEVRR